MPSFNILIVGGGLGGLGGLATAVSLSNPGHHVAILESTLKLQAIGGGITIPSNSMRCLDYLGLKKRLHEAAKAKGPERRRFQRYNGEFVCDSGKRDKLYKSIVVHRAPLQQLLVEAAIEAGAQIEVNPRVVGVDESGEPPAATTKDDGSCETGRFSGLEVEFPSRTGHLDFQEWKGGSVGGSCHAPFLWTGARDPHPYIYSWLTSKGHAMAIEDSICLAECLARAKSTSDIPKALKMSEAIGKPRTKLVTQSLAFCCFTHVPDLPCHSPFPASIVRPTGPNTLQSPHSIQLPASWHRAFQAGGRGINWKAPVQTGGLLIAGARAAFGHHFYYQHLDPKESLTAAHLDYDEKKVHCGFWPGCDFGATKDFSSFLNTAFLFNVKVGVALAALTWLMALIAIVTPATLTVIPSSAITPQTMSVPMVDYTNVSALFFPDSNTGIDVNTVDNGISPLFCRLMAATSSTLDILPMAAIPPAANYSLQFGLSQMLNTTLAN
ncbi:uncharacterized protein PAC_18806 [Phialocephala subalpina]|uniref:FAD-binding domain-containing protein n=1 Tax=Phialocephala subalpina TaxID=576137 RepID=A0A1L7XVA4_9HELO|nr:uncharacterized protein PAC_18806 [Phialocephala subalpina]